MIRIYSAAIRDCEFRESTKMGKLVSHDRREELPSATMLFNEKSNSSAQVLAVVQARRLSWRFREGFHLSKLCYIKVGSPARILLPIRKLTFPNR